MAINRSFSPSYPHGFEVYKLMNTLFKLGIVSKESYHSTFRYGAQIFKPGVYSNVVVNLEE